MGVSGGRRAAMSTGVLLFVVFAPGVDSVRAQSASSPGADEILAVRLSGTAGETPRIDGRVDEAFWSRVAPVSGFRQQNPVESAAATERTEVRVAYDDQALYVAVRAFDDRPE